jgi:hypothetical protein
MAVNTYDKGDAVRLKATFTVSSVVTDPTTVTLKVKDSDGTISTYTYAGGTITKLSTGIYYKDVTVSNDGIWYYRFEGTGSCIAAGENSFEVRRSEF